MPNFHFALTTADLMRGAGLVEAETLADALTAIEAHAPVGEGDRLLIGVAGFPPARFECVGVRIEGDELRAHWQAEWRDVALQERTGTGNPEVAPLATRVWNSLLDAR